MFPRRLSTLLLVSSWLILIVAGPVARRSAAAEVITFREHIQKVLRKNCVNCHNTNRPRAGLDLSTYEGVMRGSASGEVVSAGDPADSYLYLVAAHEEEPVMPPEAERISEADLDLLKRWIEGGLLRDASESVASSTQAMQTQATGEASPDQVAVIDSPTQSDTFSQPDTLQVGLVYRGGRATAVVAVAANESRQLVAVGGQLQVLLYDANTAELVGVLPFPEGEPQTLRFSSDGRLLVAGGGVHAETGRCAVWETKAGRRVWQGGDEYDVVLAADLSLDNRYFILGGPERLVKVMDTATAEAVHRLEKHTDWVLDACFGPDGLIFATADRDGGVYVWETERGEVIHSLGGHKGAVHGVEFCDGDVCVTAGEDGTVRRWDLHTGKLLGSWMAHETGVLDFCVLSDGRVVTVGRDKSTRLWLPDGSDMEQELSHASLPISVAALGSEKVVTGCYDGEVVLLDLSSGAVTNLEAPDHLAIQDPDELLLARAEVDRDAAALLKLAISSRPARMLQDAPISPSENGHLLAELTVLERRLADAVDLLPGLLEQTVALRSRVESPDDSGQVSLRRQLEADELEQQIEKNTVQLELLTKSIERLDAATAAISRGTAELSGDEIATEELSQAQHLSAVAVEKLKVVLTQKREQQQQLQTTTDGLREKLNELRAQLKTKHDGLLSAEAELRSLQDEILRLFEE